MSSYLAYVYLEYLQLIKEILSGRQILKSLLKGQITVLNQILIISMHIVSLDKRPCYLFKLSSGNENMGVSLADNSIKI